MESSSNPAREAARAKLAAQRQQIAADAFAAARTQLAAFAAGKDYAAWLVKSAAALAETMGESNYEEQKKFFKKFKK